MNVVGLPFTERKFQKSLIKNNKNNNCNYVLITVDSARQCDQIIFDYLYANFIDDDVNNTNQICKPVKYHNTHAVMYVPDTLFSYITNCDKRFIVVRLTLVLRSRELHSNILVFDKLKNLAYRFEPYGSYIEKKDNEKTALYSELGKFLTEIFPKYKLVPSIETSGFHGIQYYQEQEKNYKETMLESEVGFCSLWAVIMCSLFINCDGDLSEYWKVFSQYFKNQEHKKDQNGTSTTGTTLTNYILEKTKQILA